MLRFVKSGNGWVALESVLLWIRVEKNTGG